MNLYNLLLPSSVLHERVYVSFCAFTSAEAKGQNESPSPYVYSVVINVLKQVYWRYSCMQLSPKSVVPHSCLRNYDWRSLSKTHKASIGFIWNMKLCELTKFLWQLLSNFSQMKFTPTRSWFTKKLWDKLVSLPY
jgi:hypothetical protein